ncbi:hypothetical protein BD408DRAFT_138521 [Parasitella parasitica]|nr:hypothetical protein BD408DRAFT_138521 [Parasitella parasitica]
MSDYFIKTKRPIWNIDDAFSSFKAKYPDLTVEQQLTSFHDFLKKQDDPVVQSWLLKWKSFCKKPEKSKKMPHNRINLDMRRSVNQNVTIGNVKNYNNKSELEDDVERAPQINSDSEGNRSDKPFDNLFSEDEEAATVDKTDVDDFKRAVFKAGYQYFKEELSLSTISNLNKLFKGFSPTTLEGFLDMLSYELLNKEMNINEKNTLK